MIELGNYYEVRNGRCVHLLRRGQHRYVFFSLIRDAIVIIVILIICILFITKHTIPNRAIKLKGKGAKPQWNQVLDDNRLGINLLVTLFLLGICFWLTIGSLIPILKDIPYAVSNDYCKIEGIAMENSLGKQEDNIHERYVKIQNSEGEIVRIMTLSQGIHKGEYLIAYYYPNSKIAPIVERIEK